MDRVTITRNCLAKLGIFTSSWPGQLDKSVHFQPSLTNEPTKDTPKLVAFVESLRCDMIAHSHATASTHAPTANRENSTAQALLGLSQVSIEQAQLLSAYQAVEKDFPMPRPRPRLSTR